VFSVIKLTGEGLLPFNSSLGQSFVDALGNILGEPPAEDRRGGGGMPDALGNILCEPPAENRTRSTA